MGLGTAEVVQKVADVKHAAWEAWTRLTAYTPSMYAEDVYVPPQWSVKNEIESIYPRIDAAFAWVWSFPEPDTYDAAIEAVREVRQTIVGTELNGKVEDVKGKLDDWRGEGGTNFRANFVHRFESAIDNQGDMLEAVTNAYKSGQAVTQTSLNDAGALLDAAWKAFKELKSDGGSGWGDAAKLAFNIIALGTGIAAAAGTGGASAVFALSVVSGSTGFLANVIPDAPEKAPGALPGDDPLQVTDALVGQASELKNASDKAGRDLVTLVNRDLGFLLGHEKDFAPTRPTIAGA